MNVPERIETPHMRGTVAIIIVLESLTTTTTTSLIFYLNITKNYPALRIYRLGYTNTMDFTLSCACVSSQAHETARIFKHFPHFKRKQV